jgi:hypothetical protein
MTEFSDLPQIKRVKRYLELAEVARLEARRNTGPARNACMAIAEKWMAMADEASAKINAEIDPDQTVNLTAALSPPTESQQAT